MAASKGNCFICGKTAGKTAIKNHVLQAHDDGDEMCYLFKAEGAYNKHYWLLFTVPLDETLSAVDKFLRDIWCECCSHLSAFTAGGHEIGIKKKISQLEIGDTLLYEYDFGSTTEIILTVMTDIKRPKQKEKVQLLARNALTQETCNGCGAPATYANVWDDGYYCDECAEKAADDDEIMPIVNSPRSGVCGYDGQFDIWQFDPNKPFPQPQRPKRKRGGTW